MGAVIAASAADTVVPARPPKPHATGPNADRVAAIHDLAAAPSAEAVDKILALGGRGKSAPVVQQAAFEALSAMGADDSAASRMLTLLEKEAAQRKSDTAAPLAVILLSRPDSEVGLKTLKWLDGEVLKRGSAPALLRTAVTEMTRRGDADAVRLLVRMTETESFTRHFSFRRGVIGALGSIRRPEAVGSLVAILPSLTGEVRADVVAYLTAVSDRRHGLDAAAWAEWWRASGGTFRFPDVIDLQSARMLADDDVTSYYGIPLYAERLVFVIDISGSMAGPRMEAAKRELIQVIATLPDTTAITIVAFSDTAVAWNKTLVPANETNKQAATSFVASLVPRGMTASFDALDAAFSFDTEAIYFLSDGEPTAGKLVAPAAIVKFVTEANSSRRLSLYTIGIMTQGPLADFLKTLADANYGIYRQID